MARRHAPGCITQHQAADDLSTVAPAAFDRFPKKKKKKGGGGGVNKNVLV